MEVYYYSDNGNQRGHVSYEDLKKAGISKETLVWKDGLDDWQEAGSVPELIGLFSESVLTVGVADNSPLFEEATEKGGYFFRQYPLVDNGVLVENEPKGKAIRKAICDRAGEIIVVMSISPESFHDFAQALVDLQVDNAVYLVGSDSYGFFRDKYDHFTQIYEKRRGGYKYENYIKWTIE